MPRTALLSLIMLLPLAACSSPAPDAPPAAGVLSEASAATGPLTPPDPGGKASLDPAGPAPAKSPAKPLAGQAVPTNQWWTSALTGGSLEQPLWAQPLAVKNTTGGLAVSAAKATASAKSVVTPFEPALTVAGPVTGVQVVEYGAFHVVLRAALRDGGSVTATLVQGNPAMHLTFDGATPSVTATGPVRRAGSGSLARLTIAGQRWDVAAEDGAGWRQEGNRLTTGKRSIAVARVPDGVDDGPWTAALSEVAGDPVTATTSHLSYDPAAGTVTQTLAATRGSGKPSVWALLPHQQKHLVAGPSTIKGSYSGARGPLTVVRGAEVGVKVPMPGLLTAAPSVPLSGTAKAAVLADLDHDLAAKPGAGGSYFGLKELGRLATVAEVADGVDARSQRDAALKRLRAGLVDWLTYGGAKDAHYFAYERTWGGLIAMPAEFGSNDYNDHHFQYGYLVRAAAVLAAADPAFLRDYGGAVDLVARDYSGALSAKGPGGFPPFRAFNAYLGHSAASGFGPFADGNNQESSAEAVAAWEAVTRWGIVSGNDELTAYGVGHYALESATARMYWLGEGLQRPAGYAYRVAGMVWDAKLDYATWFDGKPESIIGIQLLPLTFGSLYRSDGAQAKARAAELGRTPVAWGDLFAADLALADPAAARSRLTATLPREDSTSRAMVRYWTEMLAAHGPPQPATTADSPYGLAFEKAYTAVNPTSEKKTVTFRRDGTVVASLDVPPHSSTTEDR